MGFVIAAVISYLLGSINSSILVGRIWANIDIREHGSGNAGATNTLRTLGKLAALVVLLGDVLKGVLSVVIGRYIGGDICALISGGACVLGHNYPVYFAFKGGKGILTSAGVIFMLDWKIGLILLLIFIFITAITRYVSLGSIIGSSLYPFIVYMKDNRGTAYVLFALYIAVLAIYRHKENITRLLQGRESKIGSKVKV